MCQGKKTHVFVCVKQFLQLFIDLSSCFFVLEVELKFGRGIGPRRLWLMPFLGKSTWRWVIYRPTNSLFAHGKKKAEHLQLSRSPENSMCREGSLVPLQLCRPFPGSSWAGGAAAASASPCSSWQVRLLGLCWEWGGCRCCFFSWCMSSVQEEGKPPWYVCRYSRENISTWEGRDEAAGIRTRDGEGCVKYPFFAPHLFHGLLFILLISEVAKGLHVFFFFFCSSSP